MDRNSVPTLFAQRCIGDTLQGLREGLSLFTGTNRVAVIFCLRPGGNFYILDPQNILSDHIRILADFFAIHINTTSCSPEGNLHKKSWKDQMPHQPLEIDGLISYSGTSPSVMYQIWFTEHHPSICSVGPTKCWLEHTIDCVSNDLTALPELYTGISGNYLREYATHAVRDYIVDLLNIHLGIDIHLRIFPILNAILRISQTSEEGAKAIGQIIFVEPKKILPKIFFLAKFAEDQQPLLKNYKHVRKVLQAVENSDRYLVSDGVRILGICGSDIPAHALSATFQGRIGFLRYNNESICSLIDGTYCGNSHRAKLAEVEEILLDYPLENSIRSNIFKIIEALVHNAQDKGFGCCFVIDLHNSPISIAGQSLTPPLDLQHFPKLNLAGALSKVDGALRIRADLKLHDFACLLDGYRLGVENRARGARYNSSLRFSYHHPKTIVVVVSSDRPVSIIHHGKEFVSKYSYAADTTCMLRPIPLGEWVQEKETES